MAQKRYYEFRADDDTFTLANHDLGVIPPGVYHGFNFQATSNMNLYLGHAASSYKRTNKDKSTNSGLGLLRTKQGIFIEENDVIQISNVPIGNASFDRIDLVVCEHEYKEIANGQQGIYKLIQGTPAADPQAPALTNESIQVIIGELYVPANTTALDDPGVTFTKRKMPLFASNKQLEEDIGELQEILPNLARIDQSNQFSKLQQLGKGTASFEEINSGANHQIRLSMDGNYFVVPTSGSGLEISALALEDDTVPLDGTVVKMRMLQSRVFNSTAAGNINLGMYGSGSPVKFTCKQYDTLEWFYDSGDWYLTGTTSHKHDIADVNGLQTALNDRVLDTDARLTNSRTPTGSAGGDLAGSFPNPTIGADKVNSIHIAADSLASEHYQDGSIKSEHIGTGQVKNNNYANESITEDKLVDQAVIEQKLASNSVTRNKIVNGEVTEEKLGNNAVTEEKLDSLAVSTAKLKDQAVTFEKLNTPIEERVLTPSSSFQLENGTGKIYKDMLGFVHINVRFSRIDGQILDNITTLPLGWRPENLLIDQRAGKKTSGDFFGISISSTNGEITQLVASDNGDDVYIHISFKAG